MTITTEKTDFLLVLQTHSEGNNPAVTSKQRYCGAPKEEVMIRCVNSLVKSVNHAANSIPEINFRLQVFDDHSSPQALQRLNKVLEQARFEVNVEALTTRGLMPSIHKCYMHGLEHGKELVYFVQDDYLYYENAIENMAFMYANMATALGNHVGIFPYNDPYRYQPHTNDEMLRMVMGRDRYWRTTTRTASCLMTHHDMIKQHWDLFHLMGTSEISNVMEDVSINQMWLTRGHYCFSPVPSLALHMGYEAEKDPYIDWKAEWDKHGDTDTVDRAKIPTDVPVFLNVGCGPRSTTVDIPQLQSYTEVRVDADKSVDPDIVASMTDLSVISSSSVDAVWSSHSLEHMYWHDSITALREFKRVLKQDGVLFICLPNSKSVGKALAEDKMDVPCYHSPFGPIYPNEVIFGSRVLVKRGHEFMSHKNCYTPRMLESDLKLAGFDNMLIEESGYDIKAVVSKSNDVDLTKYMFSWPF